MTTIDRLEDDRWYFVMIPEKVTRFPWASGREIKDNWKSRNILKFAQDRVPAHTDYSAVLCPNETVMLVKPFQQTRWLEAEKRRFGLL